MDSAITFTSAAAGALGLLLLGDLLVAAVRNRTALRRRLDHPVRLVLGSTICAALLVGALRPALAATPPPAMRIAATADRAPQPAPEAPRPIPHRHTVESGDSLWRIAHATLVARGHPATGTDVASFWPRIYDANRGIIGGDPHLIHPGQVLELPESGSHAEVTHGT